MRPRVLALGLAIAMIAVTPAGPALAAGSASGATATGAGSAERTAAAFVSRIAAERARRDLPALTVRADLTRVAQRWAARMAQAGDIYQNPTLGTDLTGWQSLGENVGMGPDVASVHAAFMSNPPHRRNILDRGFTEVGVGTAVDPNGTLYVVEDFRQPVRQPATTTPPATHPPAPAPLGERATRPAPTGPAAHAGAAGPAGHRPVIAAPPPAAPSPTALLASRLRAVLTGPPPAGDPLTRAAGFAKAIVTLSGETG